MSCVTSSASSLYCESLCCCTRHLTRSSFEKHHNFMLPWGDITMFSTQISKWNQKLFSRGQVQAVPHCLNSRKKLRGCLCTESLFASPFLVYQWTRWRLEDMEGVYSLISTLPSITLFWDDEAWKLPLARLALSTPKKWRRYCSHMRVLLLPVVVIQSTIKGILEKDVVISFTSLQCTLFILPKWLQVWNFFFLEEQVFLHATSCVQGIFFFSTYHKTDIKKFTKQWQKWFNLSCLMKPDSLQRHWRKRLLVILTESYLVIIWPAAHLGV